MRKTILFDFDGTIADSFEIIKKILLDLAPEFGYRKPAEEEIEILRAKPAKELFKSFGIPSYKLPFLLLRVNSEIQKHILDIRPVEGIDKVLGDLKTKNYPMAIVTSNSERNVQAFLDKYELNYFDFIQAESSILGKARVLTHVLKKHKIKKEEAIYIGDEIRDIEAAHKVGIKIISVTWGINIKEGLEKFQPDILIEKPNNLLSAIKSLV